MRKNTQETFTIPRELVKQLEEYSIKTMVPKSRVISKLLEDFFKSKNGNIIK